MSRSASSAAHTVRSTATVAPQQTTHQPANDAERGDGTAPTFVLTEAQRAHYRKLAAGVRAEDLKRVPLWAESHLAWMDAVLASAMKDRAELAKVSLGGVAVTDAMLEDFGLRVEFAREALADAAVPDATAAPTAVDAPKAPRRMTDDALAAEMRGCQTALCDALVPWCEFSTADAAVVAQQKAAVKSVRRAGAKKSLMANNQLLFKLFRDTTLVTWLRGLPKGEGAALARLTALHREWMRRRKGGTRDVDTSAAQHDLMVRAYALAKQPVARIVAAGRYLIKGRPEREGDYAGFRRPAARKPAVNDNPAPTPVDPSRPA